MDTSAQKPVISMRVGGIVVDPNTQAPIVLLRGIEEPRLYLPIFIGGMEATAIATALAGVEMPRPMTHDLFTAVLGELGATLQRVTVTDLIEGTFYAEISLADSTGHAYSVDARPSDSIAMALRSGAAIYVARAVLEEAGGLVEEEEGEAEAATDAEQTSAETPAEVAARAGAELGGDRQVPPMLDSDARLEDLDPELFGKYKM